jgi:hypothetical protein
MGLDKKDKVITHVARPNLPIVWLGENSLKDEMSEKDFMDKVMAETKTRDIQRWGRDGVFEVWKREFRYRGLPFLVKVIRYYVIGVPLMHMKGMNKLGKWAVLEYDDRVKHIVDFCETELQRSDFLYRDTLHSWNDKQNLKQMVNEMIHHGKSDIDWWLDNAERELKERNIKSLKEFDRVWGVNGVMQKT